MKKWALGLIGLVIISSAVGGYLYFKAPINVRFQDPDFQLTATELVERYADEAGANELYLGKVLAVSGTVASVSEENGNWTVFLATDDPLTGVTCSCDPDEGASVKKIKVGDRIAIKGQCTGKLMDIVLNHCSIVK